MEPPDLFELFVRPLNRAGLRYMVSGSLASTHYGEPRLTMDVDLVVHLDPADVNRFEEFFPASDSSCETARIDPFAQEGTEVREEVNVDREAGRISTTKNTKHTKREEAHGIHRPHGKPGLTDNY